MSYLRRALAVAAIFALPITMYGQGNVLLVHEKPVHARHFAGTIYDAKGMTVEYATVELRDPKSHRLLASTFADGSGNFAFDDKKYGKRAEIRAIQKGFDMAQYTVVRRRFADPHVHVVLTVGS